MALPKKPSSRPKVGQNITIIPDEKDGASSFVEKPEELHIGDESEESADGQLTLDVFQTADEIVVVAPVAGVKKEDISINIHRTDDHDEVLTIKGKRNFQFSVSGSDYFTQECFWGSFSRSIILPEAVDTTRVTASFKHGILTIRIPKVEPIKTRMISIKEE